MRDIALTLVMVGALPFAARYTWFGVLLWTWLSIMNPHRLTYGFAYDLPWAQMAAVATLLSLFIGKDKLKFPLVAPAISLVLFILWMGLTTVFAVHLEPSIEQLIKVMKIQLFTLIALAAIRERKHIELFVWINALSIAFYGLKGGIFTLRSGGGERVWGPGGSYIEGNNEIGLALIIVIPLLNYLRMVSHRGWLRHGLLALMGLSAIAAIGTQSRGAFLSIIAMGAVLWWRSSRKVANGIGIAVVAVCILAFMPQSWEERMRTIENYEADGSAMGRLNAWAMAFNLANSRITGGGFETSSYELFARYAPIAEPRAAHSIYFQALGEHGWIGLLLYLAIGFYAFTLAARVRRLAKDVPDGQWLHALASMVQVSLVGFAVGGAFLSLAYFDLPYNVLVMLVACERWIAEQRWKTERSGAFGTTVPVARLKRERAAGAHPTG